VQPLPPRVTKVLSRASVGISSTLNAVARSPRLQMLVLGCGVTLLATSLVADHRRVEAELDALGDQVEIFVVTNEIDAGDALDHTNVMQTFIPRRFRVVSAVNDITGLVATHSLDPGDVLTTSNTSHGDETIIPDGWRGLTIDAGPLAERLAPGAIVDVMANGTFLVEGARVIDVVKDSRSVLIAVPQDRVVAVADAASVGLAVLAIAN